MTQEQDRILEDLVRLMKTRIGTAVSDAYELALVTGVNERTTSAALLSELIAIAASAVANTSNMPADDAGRMFGKSVHTFRRLGVAQMEVQK